eukprot:TRINITY_DN9560_c0_g1_i2.p2 TRINITY_DN9560_c0_g1~~TRINITY_DN9560_c0_g1_i2.p2  ORF type:complete len:131 (-),score=14.67 TRINITY_DN9560_c0_g1_i2:156-548(-)
MTIVRDEDDQLTIFNPHRLTPELEDKLEALGELVNVVRLGAFHGGDDSYYQERWPGIRLWTCQGLKGSNGAEYTDILEEGNENSPVPGAEVVIFENTKQKEAAVSLPQDVCFCLPLLPLSRSLSLYMHPR